MIKELVLAFWEPELFSGEMLGGLTSGSMGIVSIFAIIFLVLGFDEDEEDEKAQKKMLRKIESMSITELLVTSFLCLLASAGLFYVVFLYT